MGAASIAQLAPTFSKRSFDGSIRTCGPEYDSEICSIDVHSNAGNEDSFIPITAMRAQRDADTRHFIAQIKQSRKFRFYKLPDRFAGGKIIARYYYPVHLTQAGRIKNSWRRHQFRSRTCGKGDTAF